MLESEIRGYQYVEYFLPILRPRKHYYSMSGKANSQNQVQRVRVRVAYHQNLRLCSHILSIKSSNQMCYRQSSIEPILLVASKRARRIESDSCCVCEHIGHYDFQVHWTLALVGRAWRFAIRQIRKLLYKS